MAGAGTPQDVVHPARPQFSLFCLLTFAVILDTISDMTALGPPILPVVRYMPWNLSPFFP